MWYLPKKTTEAAASTSKRQTLYAYIGLRCTISLIVNNMVNTERLVNLNTLSSNLIVIISVVNHTVFVTSWPFFTQTQSSIARRLNSQMVSLPCSNW